MLGGIGMNNKAEYTPEKVVDMQISGHCSDQQTSYCQHLYL